MNWKPIKNLEGSDIGAMKCNKAADRKGRRGAGLTEKMSMNGWWVLVVIGGLKILTFDMSENEDKI